jgi:hypothetical protein
MSWFPWVRPPARSNITAAELVEWLRSRAIEFGAPQQFIDALECLELDDDLVAENERLRDRLRLARTVREGKGL